MADTILVNEVHQSAAGFLHVRVTVEGPFPLEGISPLLGTQIAALVKAALAGGHGQA